jgi:hypothetical protein
MVSSFYKYQTTDELQYESVKIGLIKQARISCSSLFINVKRPVKLK